MRVEAGRLRERLNRYYALEGERAAIEIIVPVGAYVPIVRARRAPPPPAAAATPADARTLLDRAGYVMRLRTIEGYRKSLELYSRAAREFPDLAEAHRGIAWARLCTAGLDAVPPEAGSQREPMRVATERAAELDLDHPEIGALQGAYAFRYEHAAERAEQLYRAGASRGPSTISFGTSLGWLYTYTGRFAEAQRQFDRAYALDPFGFWHRHNLGSLAYFRRDHATAERFFREALEIEPDHVVMKLALARVLLHSDRGAEAVVETAWCVGAAPEMTGLALMHVMALASAGQRKAAIEVLREVERNRAGRYTSSAYLAMAYAAIDEPDQALQWLARGVLERDYWVLNIGVEPAFDTLRPRAEFAAILRALGLPPR